jgi:hypothetical protein
MAVAMTILPRTDGRLRSVLRLFPGYLRQLAFRPNRTGLPRVRGGRGWELAAYDLFLDLLLSGYAEITGRPARRGTAELLILVNRIAFLIDDEFERRIGKESVAFDDLALAADVRRAIEDMRTYLNMTCPPERCAAIRQLLRRTVETEYRSYSAAIKHRRTAASVDDLLDDAAVDSGAVMRQLAQVIGLFQGDAAPQEALDDFYALGMACRFADDLRDWRHDSRTGAGNLLLAVLARHPHEERRLARAKELRLRMNEKRWHQLCAETFEEFAELYRTHYSRIRSHTLRVAADLMMETGRLGWLPKNGGPTAARR